jgi:thiol-disulfide isomerase/thioredoxin
MNFFRNLLFLFFIFSYSVAALSATSMPVTLSDGSELDVQAYKAIGDDLVIVMPSGHGITKGLKDLAIELQGSNIETWIADPFTSWLLPALESSLNEIPVNAYVELIAHAKKTGKNIYLLSNDSGARILLEAAHQWQKNSDGVLSGLILISPNLYMQTPTAGSDGELLPITYATNFPIFLIVPSKSTLAIRINDTVNALNVGGSDVFIQLLNNVRNRFFFRQDATEAEMNVAVKLGKIIIQSMKLTSAYEKPRTAPALSGSTIEKAQTTGNLREYRGQLIPDDFMLNDIEGAAHSLSQYLGKVVLVNFWASWCPPCVHEMPSMSRLNTEFTDEAFAILAINLGESLQDIKTFLNAQPVNFTVLLDPRRQLPKKWKVFAFPTSYLLDKKGVIRYSVAGGIDWQEKEVRDVINELVSEK